MTKEALGESKMHVNLRVVSDGEEAVSYLRRVAPFEDAARPDLVLLDLNLPRLSGREVLAVVKADPDLLRIPVVVLTTSEAEEDVVRSYDLHANAYVTKPVGFLLLRVSGPPDRRVFPHHRETAPQSPLRAHPVFGSNGRTAPFTRFRGSHFRRVFS